jgi:methylmalonyl-CoA mutase
MTANATPIRLLTAVPICDGHDSAINTINLELVRHGVEVIYLGYHRSAKDIVRAAIQEDVRAIGISSYNGGHVEFFGEVIDLLRRRGAAAEIGVFGGGGGTITNADEKAMRRKGVDRIFFAGTPLNQMVEFIQTSYAKPRRRGAKHRADPDLRLARVLTSLESAAAGRSHHGKPRSKRPRVVGITGPGGAGKTTLIDELVLRCLRADPAARIAILSHDPSIVSNGALLGDRATMINSQDDRVFMRSLATRGQLGGVARTTRRCLDALGDSDRFDFVFVETVGIGQEASPFAKSAVDRTVFVLSPEYGSRLQLQKFVMLNLADVVVVNKSDLGGAKTALAEVRQRFANDKGRNRPLLATIASRHGDGGVDELLRLLTT